MDHIARNGVISGSNQANWGMVSALIAVAVLGFRQVFTSANLVVNPTLAQDWTGWSSLWTREDGVAKAGIVAGRQDGKKAILVVSKGSKDWAIQQQALAVKPMDLFEISGWMKDEGGHGEISVVTRNAKGETLDWACGHAGPKGSGWRHVQRKFVIPDGCSTIQFRLTGDGPGNTSLEDPTLMRCGEISKQHGGGVTLKGSDLALNIAGNGEISVRDRAGERWRYRSWSSTYVVKGVKLVDGRTAQVDVLDLVNDLPLKIKVQVAAHSLEAEISIQGQGPVGDVVSLPGSLVTKGGQWIVLPMNEGIRFPVEDPAINGWAMVTYGGHGLCMPWAGAYDPITGAGAMTILETPNDADVQFSQIDGALTFQPRWEASRQAFGYMRKAKLCFFDQGSFVAMAKRYRAYAKATGLFRTLAEKRTANPNVDRLIGALNVWNWDMDPVATCREMKQMGFDRVLWSRGGTGPEMKSVANLGYLPGRYDIYQDVWDPKHSMNWMPTEGWPDDLVFEPGGDWMKGWAHPDRHPDGSITWYQGGVISSGAGLERAKKKIPEDLAQVPYMARFIDTTTASPFREDYNPLHPLTRGQDRANKMALLQFCSKDMKLVTGTETGIDPSVPYVEYYEGMMSLGPYRLPDAGTFMMEYRKPTPEFLKYQVGPTYRIPLWELVYHDCTVAQWYWGDASNKAPEVWDRRDLLNILYGTAPMVMFDRPKWEKEKARMLQTYKNVCEWIRKIGYDEMVTHMDLTADHMVQRTTWSSGRSVIVNFGEIPYHGVPAMGFRVGD